MLVSSLLIMYMPKNNNFTDKKEQYLLLKGMVDYLLKMEVIGVKQLSYNR